MNEKGEKLHEILPAGESPFSVVKGYRDDSDIRAYFVVCGTHRVSKLFESEEEAIKDAEVISWIKISALVDAWKADLTHKRN